MASSSSSYNSPCAACKFLRRKCMPGCIFAPYFPPEEPQKFANVHKIFGASNVTKLLNELLPHQREDAVNSLAYEAEARVRDPVYGCVGAISFLQRQVQRLQKELDSANADLIRYACNEITTATVLPPPVSLPTGLNSVIQPNMAPRRRSFDHHPHHQFYQQINNTSTTGGAFSVPYLPWNDIHNRSGDINEGGGGGEGDGRM
ncbi:protein LATERAL ORGAN BOUNDARIES [Prunus avium]|uniref:Protein LATERAL ORGAN BOUNDARIES n=1 Tax=Prunus avium TaxID=42229 RepID=A0A6P5RFI7_PRUAV|nr:protein LATERAL ORGAN BOUNDARIES [Prunus avium]XP_021801715.1 protein LATERAL ORGAN BOUNDARIES [Prunus avium]XP_021801717.1 protein LATERAL ORGAN BOUNDARIES [Prunus avium]